MIKLRPTEQDEYAPAFRLMRENMDSYHRIHGIPWDQSWIEENYAGKDNYSVFSRNLWVGFISLQWGCSDVFVHTLQLSKSAQGSVYGYRVYNWLLQQAEVRCVKTIRCKTFVNSPLENLYQKLGFSIVTTEKCLITLEKHIDEARLPGRAPQP